MEQWEPGVQGARGLGEGCQGFVWSSAGQTGAVGGKERHESPYPLLKILEKEEFGDRRRRWGEERSFHDLVSPNCVPSFVLGAEERLAKCRSIFQEGQPGNQHPQQVVVRTLKKNKADRDKG